MTAPDSMKVLVYGEPQQGQSFGPLALAEMEAIQEDYERDLDKEIRYLLDME